MNRRHWLFFCAVAQAQWGVKVVSLDNDQTIFERNADKLFKPASNAKLYTAALALDRLGADYRIKTSFYAATKPDADGVIHGNLLVYGRGDPCFSARFNGGDYTKALQPAIEALLAAGVKRIDGGIIGDESYFHGAPFGSGWTWDDLQEYYGAPASALTFQDNTVDLIFKSGPTAGDPCEILTLPETSILTFSNLTQTVASKKESRPSITIYRPVGESVVYAWGGVPPGITRSNESISVPKPALWFAAMLKEGLAQRGVTVTGSASAENWLAREASPLDWSNLVEIASVLSRPMSEIVKQTLKPSQNLYAQLLLLQVGVTSPEDTNDDTEQAGLKEMQKFLGSFGISHKMAQLEEGSGLSRGCLVTPSATVKLLAFMDHHRDRDVFWDALPIAGVDGTLRNRFKGTPAAGHLRAKTGSLGGVNTLSGYVTRAGGEKLVFSIMLNNYRDENDARATIDAVAVQLTEFTGRSSAR